MLRFALFSLAVAYASAQTAVVTPTAPGAPTNVLLVATTASACGVRINWVAPVTPTGGKPILSYAIYSSGGGTTHKCFAIVQGAATLTHFVTGLKWTNAYTFTVTATNEIGEGPKSAESASVTMQATRECPPRLAPSSHLL